MQPPMPIDQIRDRLLQGLDKDYNVIMLFTRPQSRHFLALQWLYGGVVVGEKLFFVGGQTKWPTSVLSVDGARSGKTCLAQRTSPRDCRTQARHGQQETATSSNQLAARGR